MTDDTIDREALVLFEAMLDLPEGERDAWIAERTAGRPELGMRLGRIRVADRAATLQTGAAIDVLDEEPPPERIGAYRIVERIGRGGMGSVYRGERMTGDFAHVVAIKIIKPGLLSEALVERFERERQTLARLSHPHIAQLYDGGETESGSPYIVMECVDGQPLLQWIEAHRPSREDRRRLFADICAAVAFAHRNLIVHRDLTPSNVLVTESGVVKLIDFGIARDVDEGEEQAAPAPALSFTPGYAAPERMTAAQVTTAADIYSLGRLLEQMLPPGPGDEELKAIIAKATAVDPARRYATADALGEDIDAWFRCYTVAAVAGGRWYVARKFVARNRLAIASASALLVLLVGALAVTLVANARADRALAQAEHRFQETRAIAKALLFDAFDEVSRVPGSTRARAFLARTGLGYLEALAADAEAPLDVRVEVGRGYLRLAQVVGGGQASNLGRYEDSNALLAKAEEILAPLHQTRPDEPLVRQAMAALLVEQSGVNLYNNNEIELARRQALQAQEMLRPIAGANAENARIFAVAIQAEGDSWGWSDDYTRARDAHLRGEAFIAGLPPAIRDDRMVMSTRSAILRLLGEDYHKVRQEPEARRVLDQAVAINRELVRARPDDPTMVRKLAISLWYRAVVHGANNRDELARESIVEAVANARTLRERDPNDAGGLQLFALTGEVEADILGRLGRFQEAFAIGDQVIAAHRRLVALAGNTPGALRSMSAALNTQGGVFYNGRAYDRACATWRAALAVLSDIERRGALTRLDRNNAMPQLRDYLRRACENGPPRAGLGPSV